MLLFLFLALHLARAQDFVTLPDITVLGDTNKNSTLDFVPAVSELSGQKLERKKTTSLGETLGSEVGVSSSFFGPNASRPVIRGMDGERIRVLNNGTGVLDASAASQDHEVAVEPLSVDRIEIVRGAAALLYGSSAVGGVVNVITHRILEQSPDGFGGSWDSRSTTVDQGGSTALNMNHGHGAWTYHLDGAARGSNDYHIPGYARTDALRSTTPLNAGDTEGHGSVPNSANQTYNGALGSSYLFSRGFGGASYSHYDSYYGTVAEQHVKIKMRQDKVDLSVGWRPMGWIDALRIKNTYSDYKHMEIQSGVVGTTFTNQGDEARLELKHRRVGAWSGLMGLQTNVFNFAAIGDEKFVPPTNNQNLAAFIYEEATYGAFRPSLGVRVERARVAAAETFVDVDPANLGQARGGGAPAPAAFTDISASAGSIFSLDEVHAVVLNLAYTERAPNYQELYANGPHLATNAYERGDPSLGKEQAQSLELSYRHKQDLTQANLGVFVQDFRPFIALSPQAGGGFDPDHAPGNRDLTRYQYAPVAARFEGIEGEVTQTVLHLIPDGVVELGVKFDMVRARDRSTGHNLPRITPMRETVSATYKANHWTADIEVQHAESQNDVAPNETSTAGYTLVSLGAETPLHFGGTTLSVYGRLTNALDQEARNHVSVLKDVAPLPGRNFMAGVQAVF